MQPTENAFDRVKSLLGKMDRSIDDARRRRLREPDGDPGDGSKAHQTNTDQSAPPPSHSPTRPPHTNEQTLPKPPSRPTSKYGRARPLNTLSNQNNPDRQTA